MEARETDDAAPTPRTTHRTVMDFTFLANASASDETLRLHAKGDRGPVGALMGRDWTVGMLLELAKKAEVFGLPVGPLSFTGFRA